jgi:hypothetical protein
MLSFWAVMHDHNPDVFLAAPTLGTQWTRDELEAEVFPDQAAALATITDKLNGRGRPVEVTIPGQAAEPAPMFMPIGALLEDMVRSRVASELARYDLRPRITRM